MNGLLRQLCSRQFAVFVSVGVVCAIVDVGTLQSLVWGGSDPLAAATAGFFCALLLNFVLHLRVTFAATWSRRAVWRYLLIVAFHYGVTLGFFDVSEAGAKALRMAPPPPPYIRSAGRPRTRLRDGPPVHPRRPAAA